MRSLINYSCDFDAFPSAEFQKFHKALLLFSFNAVEVKIDYDEKLISIWNSKPLTTSPVRLFNMKEAVADKLSYSSLSETLAGCLENGKLQSNYYQKLLSEYGGSILDDNDFLSA
ncbi:hypothetical protein O4H26_07775 [Aequorivita viscosa]|nr:hypothetical protein [Aequorivita viscosa]